MQKLLHLRLRSLGKLLPNQVSPSPLILLNNLKNNIFALITDLQNLAHTAIDVSHAARSHAMDARLTKQLN